MEISKWKICEAARRLFFFFLLLSFFFLARVRCDLYTKLQDFFSFEKREREREREEKRREEERERETLSHKRRRVTSDIASKLNSRKAPWG